MPRKKKTQFVVADKPEGYEIIIGFVSSFAYTEDVADEMGGHPKVARVYRIIKDPKGYRLHIGKENNTVGLDGLWLGDTLVASRPGFKFEIVPMTPDNYLTFPIVKEDLQKVVSWIDTDNADLWEKLKAEIAGASTILQRLSDIIEMKANGELDVHTAKTPDGEISFAATPDDSGVISERDMDTTRKLTEGFNIISEKDPELFYALVDIISYVSTTYGDKYEASGMPNIGKTIATQSPTLGKGANVFNIIKYVQRYGTTGFEKSENIKDIYKAVHYALFEIMRVRHNNKSENE